MGRRSINTTKSGKYMNPTDQARKEARKKELKKNKKQRQMVRAAVLKGKDPAQILDEMEKIDEMEYNVYQPSPLNEKVLREKRKKLKETFDRVMRLYHSDDPELWAELKRKEVEYEKRRLKKQQYYESVKTAQTVQIDEIPLPQMNSVPPPTTTTPSFGLGSIHIPIPVPLPLPAFTPGGLPPGINRKPIDQKLSDKSSEGQKKDPPGCPPRPPPDLNGFADLDTDAEDDEPLKPPQSAVKYSRHGSRSSRSDRERDSVRYRRDRRSHSRTRSRSFSRSRSRSHSPAAPARKIRRSESPDSRTKPTSLQQRMLAISGQNVDEFMKEMENAHLRRKDHDKENDSRSDSDDSESGNEDKQKKRRKDDKFDYETGSESDDSGTSDKAQQSPVANPQPLPQPSIPLPPIAPPIHPMILQGGLPPPPMGMPPSMMFRPPPMRPGMTTMGRMPPGPPPGRPGMAMPQRLGIRMPPGPPPGLPPNRLHQNNKSQIKDTKGMTTITAKPQIRNLSADVTRFVPSTLRVKRDDTRKPKPRPFRFEPKPVEHQNKGATKDDAYMQFMREMQGLL